MSVQHRFARSLAIASSALLLVVGASFAHDSTFAEPPAGNATTPATWQADDDGQATDFLPPAADTDEAEQGDENDQGDDDDQGDDAGAVHQRDAGEEDHMVAEDDSSEGADENDDEGDDAQDEDADENDGDHEDADDGDHDGEHDGDDGGGDSDGGDDGGDD